MSAQERRDRLGQTGAVVRLRAASRASATNLAFAVERELFDRGLVATVVDHDAASLPAAEACAAAGLIALVPLVREGSSGFGAELGEERLIADAGDPDGLARRVADLLRSNSR